MFSYNPPGNPLPQQQPEDEILMQQGKQFAIAVMERLLREDVFPIYASEAQKLHPYVHTVLQAVFSQIKPANPLQTARTGAYGLVDQPVRFICLPGGPDNYNPDEEEEGI